MARTHARILTRIWRNPDFLALSGAAQRIYVLALTQDSLNLCGVTLWTSKSWSRLAADTSSVLVKRAVGELVDHDFVETDSDTDELWITSFLRWDGVLKVPNIIKAMSNDFDTIRSGRLRASVVSYLQKCHLDDFCSPPTCHLDGFCAHLAARFPYFREGGIASLNPVLLIALGERPSEPFQQRLPEPFQQPLGELPVPVSSLLSPVPSPSLPTADAEGFKPHPLEGDLELRSGDGDEPEPSPTDLAHRLAATCVANHRVALTEAHAVVAWALRFVDPRLVDEVIGWAENREGEHRLALPRAAASVIRAKARDAGIAMPEFDHRRSR